MDCKNRRWLYQVCNEIQSRLQKNIFWSDLTKDCKTAKRMPKKKAITELLICTTGVGVGYTTAEDSHSLCQPGMLTA